jgi:hypothetical protein
MLLERMEYVHKGGKMVNYSNGKVYKLVSFQSNDVYYGSTCSPLSKRFAGHKSQYKRWKAGKIRHMSSFEIVKHPDTEIILVENVNCASKEALHAAERRYIENNECVNKFIPGRTCKEYHQDNRERLLIRMKKYHQDNKDDVNQKKREKLLCECGYNYTKTNIARHKHSKNHLKYLLSIATSDTEEDSSSSYEFDGVPHTKIVSL